MAQSSCSRFRCVVGISYKTFAAYAVQSHIRPPTKHRYPLPSMVFSLTKLSSVCSSVLLVVSLLSTTARGSQQVEERDKAHPVPCRGLLVLDPRIECGQFDVPVDWAYPDGEHGQIRYIKHPAAANVTREGTIFLRPGAPFDKKFLTFNEETWFMGMAAQLHSSTNGTYDLVFFDVRGRGDLDRTFPGAFTCFNSFAKKRAFYLETSAELGIEPGWGQRMEFVREQTYEDAQNWLLLQSKMVEHCLKKQDTTKLKYIGTAAAVRDLLALADYFDGPGSKVNYWGLDHGALIGTYLLHMFPERAGRVVLQAPLDPSEYTHSDSYEAWLRGVRYAHQAFRGFVGDCMGRDQTSSCNLVTNPTDGQARINALLGTLALARSKFIGWENSLGVDMNNTILASVVDPTVVEEVYPNLNSSLAGVVHLLQRMVDRDDELGLGTMPLICGDQAAAYSSEAAETRNIQVASELKDALHAAPLFAPSIFPPLSSLCHIWPIRAVEALPDLRAAPASNLSQPPLVLQFAQDPFYRPAESLLAVLPGIQNVREVMQLRISPDGISPQTCMGRIAFAYLANGTLPTQRVCYGSEDTDTPPARLVDKSRTAPTSYLTSFWRKVSSAASLLAAGSDQTAWMVAEVTLACCAAVVMKVVKKRRPHGGTVRLEGQEGLKVPLPLRSD
ncbi:hypothetical protein FKP32DRAFT_261803 [Trametes sanguinea]|nr:hypothetical protein FKP32DRAFT_261803 [Trametes sanguinea]